MHIIVQIILFYKTKRPDPHVGFYDHADDADPVCADDHALSPYGRGDDCVHQMKRPVERLNHGHDHGEDPDASGDDYAPAGDDCAHVNAAHSPEDILR